MITKIIRKLEEHNDDKKLKDRLYSLPNGSVRDDIVIAMQNHAKQ